MKDVLQYCLLFLILLGCQGVGYAQLNESDVKAAYIERFTRFVEWSDDDQDSVFIITVVGQNTLGTSLDSVFHDGRINSQNVVVSYCEDFSSISKTDLIFVCNSEKNELSQIVQRFSASPVLIISDTKGFATAGTHINMYVDDRYIRFEINKNALEKSGLKISSLLLAAAKIVKSDD